MPPEENLRAELARLETYRYIAMATGLACTLIGLVLQTDLLDIPHAIAWGAAGVFAWLEAGILKRMGESPYPAYGLAACMVIVGLASLV